MGGEHDGNALGIEAPDIVPELLAKLDIDAGSRLVQHQDRRRMDHRLGDKQSPLHPAGKRTEVAPRLALRMDGAEQLLRPQSRLWHAVGTRLLVEGLGRGGRAEHTSEPPSSMGTPYAV